VAIQGLRRDDITRSIIDRGERSQEIPGQLGVAVACDPELGGSGVADRVEAGGALHTDMMLVHARGGTAGSRAGASARVRARGRRTHTFTGGGTGSRHPARLVTCPFPGRGRVAARRWGSRVHASGRSPASALRNLPGNGWERPGTDG